MRIRYNFAFKNSKLSPWQRPAPPNLLISDATLDKKIIFLYKEFHKNAEIFYEKALNDFLPESLKKYCCDQINDINTHISITTHFTDEKV